MQPVQLQFYLILALTTSIPLCPHQSLIPPSSMIRSTERKTERPGIDGDFTCIVFLANALQWCSFPIQVCLYCIAHLKQVTLDQSAAQRTEELWQRMTSRWKLCICLYWKTIMEDKWWWNTDLELEWIKAICFFSVFTMKFPHSDWGKHSKNCPWKHSTNIHLSVYDM